MIMANYPDSCLAYFIDNVVMNGSNFMKSKG